jgi:hypothetical protein
VREPRAIGCVPSIHLAHAAPLGTERGRTSRGAYVSRLPLLPTLDARLVCAVGSIHPLLNRWSRLRYYESNVRPQRIHMVQVLEVVRSNPFDLSNSVSTILFAHTCSSQSFCTRRGPTRSNFFLSPIDVSLNMQMAQIDIFSLAVFTSVAFYLIYLYAVSRVRFNQNQQ